MILSDTSILAAIKDGDIKITPFQVERLGPNSYDVTLARTLLTLPGTLDAARECEAEPVLLTELGGVLQPGQLHLGTINEHVATSTKYVPMIDGTSSAGRLGISVHVTAGRGDAGYAGHFTLEISVVQPVRVYPDMPIGQIWWLKVDGEVGIAYGQRTSSNYHDNAPRLDPWPKTSAMWKKLAGRGEASGTRRP